MLDVLFLTRRGEVLRKFLLAIAVTAATSSYAAPVIDQDNAGARWMGEGISQNYSLAQSFRVGLSGLLTGFDLDIWKELPSYGRGSAEVYLRSSVNGENLANFNFSSWASGFAHFDVSSFNINVSAGDEYFIVIKASDSLTQGAFWKTDPYSSSYDAGSAFFNQGGSIWYATSTDLRFATFVDQNPGGSGNSVPEPSTLFLSGAALAGLGVLRRARKS